MAAATSIWIDPFVEPPGRELKTSDDSIPGIETLVLHDGEAHLRFVCAADSDSWPDGRAT